MKDFFELSDNPEYQENIPKLSRDDPADAISVLNPLLQILCSNIHFIRLLAATAQIESTTEISRLEKEFSQQLAQLLNDFTR